MDSLLPKNLLGPYCLLEGAAAAGVGRVILTSSIYAVRGHGPSPPITADRPTYPEGLYGATKTFLEAMGRVYSDTHGLSTVVVRLGNPRMEQGNVEQVPRVEMDQGDGARLADERPRLLLGERRLAGGQHGVRVIAGQYRRGAVLQRRPLRVVQCEDPPERRLGADDGLVVVVVLGPGQG
eukprot:COSAG04_NODE_7253_length_1160_cov_0.756833_1_plen_179_part_10